MLTQNTHVCATRVLTGHEAIAMQNGGSARALLEASSSLSVMAPLSVGGAG
jgi:hypothetical protein